MAIAHNESKSGVLVKVILHSFALPSSVLAAFKWNSALHDSASPRFQYNSRTNMESNNHALVIGASGLIGWAVVEQLLQHPAFGRVTALVNRPLALQDTFWPTNADGRPKLSLISGINLTCSDAEFEDSLRDKVADGHKISHVFYFGILISRPAILNHTLC